MRHAVPAGRSRLAALVAVLALVAAVPVERQRGCTVCPVDCPMHAAGKAAPHVGCHRAMPHAAAPADDGACAMRAGCGHHDGAAPAAFHTDLAAVAALPAPAVAGTVAWHDDATPPAPTLQRLDRPPRSITV